MFCGAENTDSAELCSECGVSFEYYDEDRPLDPEEQEILADNQKLQEGKGNRPGSTRSGKTHMAIRKKPGALAALALFTVILCHIGALRVLEEYWLLHLVCMLPGLIAFMNAINLNSWETYERQDKEENLAALLCVVGLIIGIVLLLVQTH
jgi:hypothetical protein